MRLYRLIGRLVVPCANYREWIEYRDKEKRVVGRTEVGPFTVSTVFVGIELIGSVPGAPLVFETMIFRGDQATGYQERCATWLEAEAMHGSAIKAMGKEA